MSYPPNMHMKSLANLLIASSLLAFSAISFASEEWLLGNWVMTYDPDGDTEDILSFYDDGRFVTTEQSTGNQIDGTYLLRSGKVQVSLISNGRTFMKFELTFEEQRDKLYYTSGGTTSYYTKME